MEDERKYVEAMLNLTTQREWPLLKETLEVTKESFVQQLLTCPDAKTLHILQGRISQLTYLLNFDEQIQRMADEQQTDI